MHRFTTAIFAGLALMAPALAQEGGLPPQLAEHWKTSKKYVIALAEQMPAADYTFKPNAEEMSFGEQMAHIAGANSFFFATLSGQKDPIPKPTKFDKESVLKLLNTSYDFVLTSLQGLDPAKLHETFDSPAGKMTGVDLLLLATDHTAHHRGQCIVYLRMKGIKPAQYEF